MLPWASVVTFWATSLKLLGLLYVRCQSRLPAGSYLRTTQLSSWPRSVRFSYPTATLYALSSPFAVSLLYVRLHARFPALSYTRISQLSPCPRSDRNSTPATTARSWLSTATAYATSSEEAGLL